MDGKLEAAKFQKPRKKQYPESNPKDPKSLAFLCPPDNRVPALGFNGNDCRREIR
jgi:hypothetical protein